MIRTNGKTIFPKGLDLSISYDIFGLENHALRSLYKSVATKTPIAAMIK